MANQINRISIVIPLYNEADSVTPLLERLHNACDSLNLFYEIILVDDGSLDNTSTLIIDAAHKSKYIVAMILNRNYGQHLAIMAGFKQCRGDIVITLDADLQNPPEAIPELVKMIEQGYDIVGTVRLNRKDPLSRKIFSSMVNWLVKKSTGQIMSDYGCMLRAYRRSIIDAMLLCPEHRTFIPILANNFAKHVTEISVEHHERQYGVSKYNFVQLVNLLFDLITCMTTSPLRLLSILGIFITISGFLLSCILSMIYLILTPIWITNSVFPLFSIILILFGIQLIGLGILGEYVGRTYNDARRRPHYFVKQIIRDGVVINVNQEKSHT